jgi:hypothetical protein
MTCGNVPKGFFHRLRSTPSVDGVLYIRHVPALTRVLAGLALAVTAAVAPAACSDGGPSRDDVAAKIRADPRTADSPAAVVDCLTDWYMDSATPKQRKAFVDNRAGDPASPVPPDDTMVNCLKEAA